MMRLNDGTLQINVRDGKVMVVALNLGGGDMSFSDDGDTDFSFQVATLMAGMEFVLRMNGANPQALDFREPDEAADRISKLVNHYAGARTIDFPPPPPGL